MMIIRHQQLDTFAAARRLGFEKRMMAHLMRFFPARCERLGEGRVLDRVRYGMARAATYGISSERDLCKYIDLTFALGREFDTDPRLDWVRPILTDPRTPDPSARIDAVCEAAITWSAKHRG